MTVLPDGVKTDVNVDGTRSALSNIRPYCPVFLIRTPGPSLNVRMLYERSATIDSVESDKFTRLNAVLDDIVDANLEKYTPPIPSVKIAWFALGAVLSGKRSRSCLVKNLSTSNVRLLAVIPVSR